MTNSSADEISVNSNDLNEMSISHHSNQSFRIKVNSRRRRKRTIFTAADIEHLKEAFIQNPKPSRKYRSIFC